MKNLMDGERLEFMHQPSFNLPKSLLSQSEIKSPTLNSSYFQNFRSQQDQGSPCPKIQVNCSICKSPSQFLGDQIMINDATPTTQIKKSYFQNRKQKIIRSPQLSERQIHNLVRKFVELLIRQAYIYKESFFNIFQKTIMTEKYLQGDSCEFHQNSVLIIYRVVWDLLYLLLITALLIQLPLQIGLELQNNQIQGFIIIPLIIMEIAICYYESQIAGQHQHFRFNKLNKAEVAYLISYSLIQGTGIFNEEVIIVAHIISFFCGLIKVEQLLDKNQIYFSFNLSTFRYILKLFFIIHFSACVWLFLGIQDNSWISDLNIQENDYFTKYSYSFYWSTATLFGIGQSQINATNQAELLYSSAIMFLSGWILASLFVTTHELLKEKNKIESLKRYSLINNHRQQVKMINKLLESRKISQDIKRRIREYFSHPENQYDLYQIISQLPKELGDQVTLQMRKQALQNCKFLNNYSENSRKQLINVMQYKNYNPNDIIHQTDAALNIIDFGRVDAFEYEQIVSSLKGGDYFGEYSFISGELCTTKFKSITTTGLYQIQYTDFIKVISQNKLDNERFLFLKDSLFNRRYKTLGMKCYSCSSYSHLIKDCPIINYKPNLIRIISKSNRAYQQRKSFMRNQNIDYRVNNRIFKRLSVKFLLTQINLSCLDILQVKMKVIYPGDSSEEQQTQEEVADQILDQLNEQMQSNLSYSKVNECKKDMYYFYYSSPDLALEHFKSTAVEEKINENLQQKQNSLQGTIGTAQFQQDQQQYQLLAPQSQKIYIYGTQLKPFEKMKSGNSLTQLEQASQSCLSNEGLSQRKKVRKHSKGQIKYKQAVQEDSAESCLPKIKEEDSSFVNSALYKQEELLIPKFEKYSQNSLKSRNTPTNQQSRQSSRKFSSKLSTIQYISSELVNHPKRKLSQFAKNQFQQLPIAKEIVDLSLYNDNGTNNEDFETMYLFTIYYPLWNYTEVIQRLQFYLNWKWKKYT